MLGIMFQKLLSKKWMFFCLLLGSVLLIATAVSFPMSRDAALDRMLRDGFRDSYLQTGDWPATLSMVASSQKETGGELLYSLDQLMQETGDKLGLDTIENVALYKLTQWQIASTITKSDLDISDVRLAGMSGLAEHAVILSGELYSEDGMTEDGCIEVLISQNTMASTNMMLGDIYRFTSLKDEEGNPLRLKIIGIFKDNKEDRYWDIGISKLTDSCLMQYDLFREMFLGEDIDRHNVTCTYCYVFDYSTLRASAVDELAEAIREVGYRAETALSLLEDYQSSSTRVSATLFILQVPIIVLLGAFLFMVSGQMYELERNEISVIKSRGSSGSQIFRLYMYQSIFLTAAGVLIGIPLGAVFCRILGSASSFLEFGLRRKLEVHFDGDAIWFLAASALLTVLIMALPAIRHSKVSIVHLKQKKATRKRAWWEMFFLDFVCLGIGLYGYFNFQRNQGVMEEDVFMGQALDPLLYLSSSMFIVGMGLLFLRLQPLLVKLIYLIGQRFWNPASYASFMETLKNGRKQQFIMLFLILVVSLGSFHATVARTILQNAQNNIQYMDGADIIIKELWRNNFEMVAFTPGAVPRYFEPDFKKYTTLEAAESYTKVLYDDLGKETNKTHSYINTMEGDTIEVTLMGIQTKEFGEATWVERELLEQHYYEYLNALADDPTGVLVSRNFETLLGYELGYGLNYTYESSMGSGKTLRWTGSGTAGFTFGKIVGFLDYWPGYEPVTSSLDKNGNVVKTDNYLVVVNWGSFEKFIGSYVQPYEVWIKLKEGADSSEVAQWINDNGVSVEKYIDRQADLKDAVESPLLQGTNGVLTMGFLVMILLCAVGYLIYWIMSIRSREMIFGVLRAFGMHKRELFQMLMLEQIFSGILSILVGIGIGRLTSKMFVPMLQLAYAAANQVVPLQVYTNPEDFFRLYGALALMMVVCLVALIVIVFKLNIAKALKLGEE